MALANISVPQFPSIPDLPGVPAVVRDPLASVNSLVATVSGIIGLFSPKFGIFNDAGQQVAVPDTFMGIRYTDPHRLAVAPLEKGSFTSYNKVTMPFDGTVIMTIGRTVADRQQFLDSLKSMANDTNLYSIVTPEAVYQDCNLESFDYRRETKSGAHMITAYCHFKEIRQAQGTQYSSKSSVPDASRTNATTSTGMPDPVNTSSVTAQAIANNGLVNAQAIGNQVQYSIAILLAGGGG